ncbi:MAG: orotidine-5'-phosphate decarboxylase [Bifidobacteriaceae bacterium]|jgi:orotidine-5'-phosphate decarboxylase|nr:orotidine-5'-phosphate decarboxylase [Bifidobacteriaceae bacterium]
MFEKRPIIALDLPNKEMVIRFIQKFDSRKKLFLKVGMELFYKTGPSIIDYLQNLGHDIFLDLKLHDIPNTVKKAINSLLSLNVAILDIHATGGFAMMKEAKQIIQDNANASNRPKLLAITQLTSTSQNDVQTIQLIDKTLEESVLNYAIWAKKAGLDGVVCSAQEVKKIKQILGLDFLCLTPGIRPAGNKNDDQKRIMTPRQARQNGSDYIVIGRPITQSSDPEKKYLEIKHQWNLDGLNYE